MSPSFAGKLKATGENAWRCLTTNHFVSIYSPQPIQKSMLSVLLVIESLRNSRVKETIDDDDECLYGNVLSIPLCVAFYYLNVFLFPLETSVVIIKIWNERGRRGKGDWVTCATYIVFAQDNFGILFLYVHFIIHLLMAWMLFFSLIEPK